jgi:hypothetical protein
MPRSRALRSFAALLALGLLLALPTLAPRPAAAQFASADLALLRLTGPHAATPGRLITIRTAAANLGPAGSELDVIFTWSAGLQLTALTCDRGISPDTPGCEYSNTAPGEQVTTLATFLVTAGAGSTETITACTSNEGQTEDPNPDNDCRSLTLAIVGN